MPKIKFKKLTISWKKFFNYIFLILLSSAILLTFLIALPLTEKLTKIVAFDLNISDQFWSKEYILTADSEDIKDIRKVENILFKRLNDYGVEEVSIKNNEKTITVVVKTTKQESYVDELVKNPYRYSIVTRKDGVDFESEDNQLTPYLIENYDETQFNSNSFRTIYITKLSDSSGGKSYFGLAKPWLNNSKEFKNFLQEYNGKYVGVNIDGFVTPVHISDTKVFAIPLNVESDAINVLKVLYNSGNMPISYQLGSEKSIETNNFDINYIQLTIALFVSIILIYLYTFFTKIFNKDLILRSLFSTLFSLALLLAFFKIELITIIPFILVIDAILMIVITNLIQQNKDSRFKVLLSIVIFGFIFKLLGIGYLKILGNDLLIISILSYLGVLISNFYINKISDYFKK